MFKDSMGRWLTKALFYEANNYQLDNALFTLGEEDREVNGKTLLSLRKRFVEAEDSTGYTIAMEYLGGYEHWSAICKSSIKTEIAKWQEELEMKLRCIGLRKTIESAKNGNFNAAKFLVEKGWDKRQAGRPSAAEVEGERKKAAQLLDVVDDDIRRMENVAWQN